MAISDPNGSVRRCHLQNIDRFRTLKVDGYAADPIRLGENAEIFVVDDGVDLELSLRHQGQLDAGSCAVRPVTEDRDYSVAAVVQARETIPFARTLNRIYP